MVKLNIGCGNLKMDGWINIDASKYVNPDLVLNLEDAKLPFKNNEVSEIKAFHVLEHIYNFIPLMKEMHRICKKNAEIHIKVPFYSAWGQYNDPTHVRFFTPLTFSYFKKNNYSHELGVKKDMFDVKKVKINYGIGQSKKLNWIMNPLINLHHNFYCRFFAFIIPASEIEFVLKVIK